MEQCHIHLKPGAMLGIAGPVGSGKSTLVALLLRQQELQHGEIRYGEVLIKEAKLINGAVNLRW
ncbi:ATP-binding cassette domain-containing protein [Vibrio metschnikovii]